MPWGATVITIALACGCEERAENFDSRWARHTIDDSDRGADGVRVADVNGDGNMDVVSSCKGKTRAVIVSFAPSDGRRPISFGFSVGGVFVHYVVSSISTLL